VALYPINTINDLTMKISKFLLFFVVLLSSCAVKYPNQTYPQGVFKIYIVADKGDVWTNKFFMKKLQALLQEHKVEIRVGEKSKTLFMEATDFSLTEQQKKMQDITSFKPDIILELTAFNYAINAKMAVSANKSATDIAVVKDTADLKRAIEKAIEIQDNKDAKKLTNYARASAFLYLPNQYAHVWHTGIVETDPDLMANTAEGSLTKAAESMVKKLVDAKIIK
jgi:hypothetical protein